MRFGSIVGFVVLAGLGAAGWYWLKDPPAPSGPPQGGGRRAAQRQGTAPVSVASVRKENVPVYREGIGNVQALQSVVVRAQIDARLLGVNFEDGQMVKRGDLLARLDPAIYQAQYDQAVAKKAQDEATLANARIDLARYQKLAQANAGPQQQADQQAATVAQLEAQVKSDQAAIDSAKTFLGYTTIAAPIDGRAGLRQVDPGNIVRASDANGLVSITQVSPIATVFTLPQRDLPQVSAAMARGPVAVEVLDSGATGVLARGELKAIDNQIDSTTGTIRLKAEFPNGDEKLWPGQFVSVRVTVETLADGRVVPASAIRRGPNGTFVYAVDDQSRAVVRPVEVALQDDSRAVIAKGLEFGERIVTVGFVQLSDGRPVEIVSDAPPAQQPAASAGAGADGGARAETKREGKRRADGDGPNVERTKGEWKKKRDARPEAGQ